MSIIRFRRDGRFSKNWGSGYSLVRWGGIGNWGGNLGYWSGMGIRYWSGMSIRYWSGSVSYRFGCMDNGSGSLCTKELKLISRQIPVRRKPTYG